MKILIGNESFEVDSVKYCMGNNGMPIDIVIEATKETLEGIANYCTIGCNIQYLGCKCPETEVLYEGLFGRLNPFTLEGFGFAAFQ